ncbi:MAG: PQQ-binding-like beta-propeller repeat protein [Polyangiaceae bacterium]
MRTVAALLGAALITTLPAAARAHASCSLWSQGRCDAANSASITIDAPKSGPPRAWTFDGSGRVWGYEPGMTIWSPPTLGMADKRAVVAVGSYDHTVYALDASSGNTLWKFTTGGPVFAAPVFWEADGKSWVFVASTDRTVYAIDAEQGRPLWVHEVEDYRATIGGARLGAPSVGRVGSATDAVFVSYWVWDGSLTHNEAHARVVALSAREGKPLWRSDLGDNELTATVFAQSSGRNFLLLGSSNGNVYALSADTGRLLWAKTELDSVRSPPAFVESAVGPLVVMASKYGSLRGLSIETGAERWHYKTGDRITGSPSVLGSGRGARVFVGSYDRHLYCLDAATGKEIFARAVRGGIYSSPALVPSGAHPMVLASAWDNQLHAVGLSDGASLFSIFTGRPIWNVAGLDESNWSSPAAALVNGRWMAYVGSYDGALRALPLEDDSRIVPRLRSNLGFWISFPLALAPLALLARALTVRARRREGQRLSADPFAIPASSVLAHRK